MTDTCYLCLEPLTSKIVTTGCDCNSKLHKKCFKMLVKTQDNNLTCSICKNDFSYQSFTTCFKQNELFGIMTTNKKPKIPEDCVSLDNHVDIYVSNIFGLLDIDVKTDTIFKNMLFSKDKVQIHIDNRNNNINVNLYCKKTDYYNYLNALSAFVNQSKSKTRELQNKKYTNKHFQIKKNRTCTHYRR